MKRLCIVPCGSKKIWKKNPKAGATEAKNVYVGSFAKKCIEYAKKFHAGHYRILSAKYGLMQPNFRIPLLSFCIMYPMPLHVANGV